MTEVGDKVFSCCTDMISIEIPHGVTAIHSEAFFQCLELRNVAIPDSVNVVGENAFECCFKLQDTFPEEDSLVEALKTRFDDLPLHKICYYQAHQPTEETLQELSEAMMDMDALETVGGERTDTMRQDAFGMTPLHILSMSKKQDLELYQFLVETYPEDLTVYDTWGYLPLYYACLSDAPMEIVQYLLDTHKRISKNAAADMPWQSIVDSFSIMFVSAAVLKCVIHWTIVDKLQHVPHFPWREEIVNAIDLIPDGGRKTWKEKDRQVNAVYDLLKLYELKEMTSILELAAWKSKVDQSQGVKRHLDVEQLPADTVVAAADYEKNTNEGGAKRWSSASQATSRLSNATHTTRSSMETVSIADRHSINAERESIFDRASIIGKTVVEENNIPTEEDKEDDPVQVDSDPQVLSNRNNCRINSGAELIISNVMPFCLYPQPLWAAELKQSTTQFNDTAVGNSLESSANQDTSSEEYVRVELSGVSEVAKTEAALGLSDEDMVRAMSEQMSDLLTALDGNNEEPENDVIEIDNPIYSSFGAEVEIADKALEEEPSIPEIVDEMLHSHNDDYHSEEDPVLRELEETLLSTIQVLEDTLQETQIVNELETRELKEDQASLEKELQDQKQLNEQVMAKLQRVSSEQDTASQAPKVSPIGSAESLLDPSIIPEEGVVVTSNDITKVLQIQEEKHLQEMKALESKLRNQEEQRLEMEESNARLEAAASAAKITAEDTKQDDSVLQKKLKEQQESLELANRKMEKLESELSTSKQELEEQTTSSKFKQAAAKTKEQELHEKLSKMEAEIKKLTMNDAKAQTKISNLEAAQTELEETLRKVKHEKAVSKASATSAQKETKRAKQSLAESMAKIGRLETKQARAQIQSQKKASPSPPKKASTTRSKEQPPKESAPAVTAQKTPRLDNWELTDGGEVQGSVFNHPSLPDGEPVRTSVLVNPKAARDGAMVKTGSGSRYKLGKRKTVPPPPKEPVAATKPEHVMKKQMPKQTASTASPSINLFSSFQAKPKNPVKKEEPKEIDAASSKAKKSTPAFTSIFGATSSKAKKAAKDPEAPAETERESTEAETLKEKKSTPTFSSIFGASSSK
ncbi:MAG: hypothetical protein SGBAC_013243, partial [Bacillariaceae sp.]